MKILGVDYGRKKIGLSIGESGLAEPWKVVGVDSFEDAIGKVKSAYSEISADKIVVGISEGEMGEESKKFAGELGAETFDETLSSQDAQALSRESGVPQKKRHEMEDAYAASLMLQNYIDSIP